MLFSTNCTSSKHRKITLIFFFLPSYHSNVIKSIKNGAEGGVKQTHLFQLFIVLICTKIKKNFRNHCSELENYTTQSIYVTYIHFKRYIVTLIIFLCSRICRRTIFLSIQFVFFFLSNSIRVNTCNQPLHRR